LYGLAGMRSTLLALLALPGLFGSISGCGATKQTECTALIEVVNAGLKDLENGQQQAKNDPSHSAEVRAMAAAMETAAAKAAELSFTIPELRELSQRYQTMAKNVAKFAREIGDASDKKDMDALGKARTALNDALKQEDPIVDDLNKFCAE
jgi:chromosome segregation ATPase